MKTLRTIRTLWRYRDIAWRLILRRSLLTSFRYDGMTKFQTVRADLRFVWVCSASFSA